MFVDVETFFLNALVNTETDGLIDSHEEDDTAYCSPKVDDNDTEALCSKECETVAVEDTLRKTEETSQDCAEDTADTVN